MPVDPTKKPAGQKRPPRSAGRRRLDGPGEAKLSEDRRSQIRRAQRTYRLKKEASLQQAQKQVAFLEQKIQKIAESLADYRASLQSSLKDDHSELLNDFDDVLKLLSSTSEDIVQDACFDTFSSSQPSPKSNPDSNRAVQCDDVFASNVIFDNEAITESNFTCIHRPLEIEVSSYQENGDKAIMQEGDEIECDLPIVQVADRFGAANVLYTYSFLETSFTRRLKRTSLEHAFRIFSDPRSHPLEVFRIFRLVPCFRDKEKMYPYFKDLVSSDRGGSLEISALPFYCIGGAGTHYTTKDEQGKPIYPPKMRIPRRILGTLPMTGTTGGLDAVHQQPQNLELCGYGGQWFDCRDVEGYLREKGVDLDGAGLFPIVHGLPPSPESSDQQNDKPTSAQCPDHPHDVTISESPQPSSCTFDLESFLMALLRGVAILGRAPGFRRSDVETAFQSALMRTL